MQASAFDSKLFIENRERITKLMLPNSLAVANANDIPPTNADGTIAMVPNSDLFYLSGIAQEQSLVLLFPDAPDENQREILFLRDLTEHAQTWEGHKLTREEARKISGIRNIQWLSDFPSMFHRLMCGCEHVYLNSNEHQRAEIEVETRDARFIAQCQRKYPLHQYHRLARLLHTLRIVKSEPEIDAIRQACKITGQGFVRVMRCLKPGSNEADIEAELAHEFIRNHCRFAYLPIIATGINGCSLHYNSNDTECRKGELVLMDTAAAHSNYNSDLTRTIPVNGRFSRRQKQVYNAVLRVFRGASKLLTPGKLPRDWQKEAEQLTEKELVDLGLISLQDIKKQLKERPALKKYFMHGIGHPIGLDVHDVGYTTQPIKAGWVMTCEPGIYIPEEKLGIRLENTLLVTDKGSVDLMADIPLELDAIESIMNQGRK
jgi:Xaa-Pro aminopeptidase